MKTIHTINCGNRAKACAQGLACAVFNADEMDLLDSDVGVRYQGSDVNIVVDDEDFDDANPKQILRAINRAMRFVIKASKKGFDGNSPEEMLEIFSYPDEGTGGYSNVVGKTDLTVADLEFLQKELNGAASNRMGISEAKEILKDAGMRLA